MKVLFKIIFCCIIVLSCKDNIIKQTEVQKSDNSPIENSSTNNSIESKPQRLRPILKSNEGNQTDCGYDDGSYSAEVDYYNPKTGFTNTYELNVQVQDCNIIEIDFPKGGWLDSDHIDPTAIDEDGNASIEDDQGRNFDVHLSENDKKIKDEDDNNTEHDGNDQ